MTLDVAGTCDVSVGTETTIDSGRKITIEAGHTLVLRSLGTAITDTVELRTPSASIVLKGNGEVEIKGTKITIQSQGDLVLKASKIVN